MARELNVRIAVDNSDALPKLAATERAIGGITQKATGTIAPLNTAQKVLAEYGAKAEEAGTRGSMAMTGLQTRTSLLGTAVGFAIGGVAVGAVLKFGAAIGEAAGEGLRLEGLRNSFERLAGSAGQNANAIFASLQKGTQGLVKNVDLFESANKALLMGLPASAASMGKMATDATILGRAVGLDATTALNKFVDGLGKSSAGMLESLGLTVNSTEANEAYAKSLGKTVGGLTDAEKQTAFYVAAMADADAKVAELGAQHSTFSENIVAGWNRISNGIATATSWLDKFAGGTRPSDIEAWGILAHGFNPDAALDTMPDVAKKNLNVGAVPQLQSGADAMQAFVAANGTPEEIIKRAEANTKFAASVKTMADQMTGRAMAEDIKVFVAAFDQAQKSGGMLARDIPEWTQKIFDFAYAGGQVPPRIMAWAESNNTLRAEGLLLAESIMGTGDAVMAYIQKTAISVDVLTAQTAGLTLVVNRNATDIISTLQETALSIEEVAGTPPPFDPWMNWAGNFGLMLDTIQGKFDGWGSNITDFMLKKMPNIFGAGLSSVSSGLLKSFGGMLTGGLSSLLQMGVSFVWNGLKSLGSAIASAFGANSTKGGREDFAKSMGFESLGNLYAKLQTMGPEGARLADIGLNVIGKNDKEKNQVWLQEVSSFLSRNNFSLFDQMFGGTGGGGATGPGGFGQAPADDSMAGGGFGLEPRLSAPASTQQTVNVTVNLDVSAVDESSFQVWLNNRQIADNIAASVVEPIVSKLQNLGIA